MADNKPLVSIGLPVYNGENYLREALDSLLVQEYENFELVISDNASTDMTAAICREYKARDNRIAYHRAERNQGAVWNFNHVFKLAQGEFFMWAAHDDFWHPQFMARCVQAMQERPEAVLCHTYAQLIAPDGRPLRIAYAGYVNEEAGVRARWRRIMEHWELHAAIYGIMRRAPAQATQLLSVCNCADFIFVAELMLHGQLIQVPEALAYKRVMDEGAAYRSPEEMLAYLGGSNRKRLRLVRLKALRECLRGLKHADLEPQLYRQLYMDTLRIYFGRSYCMWDLKECASTLLRSIHPGAGIKSNPQNSS